MSVERESGKPWVVMPFIDLWNAFTLQAAVDVVAQTAPNRLLLVDNGSGERDRAAADQWVEIRGSHADRSVLIWHHAPPLPTLDATWNRALEAAWQAGAERALVVNNDVRLPPELLALLLQAMNETDALFVSAVNVGEDGFGKWKREHVEGNELKIDFSSRGGPDYSCFLISRECHERYPFDPQFTYCGDLDHHRRIMLGGEGKRIFGVCVPYLHYASRTVARHPKLALAATEHRRLYAEKWGGEVNQEKYQQPYASERFDGVTTPELQRNCLEG